MHKRYFSLRQTMVRRILNTTTILILFPLWWTFMNMNFTRCFSFCPAMSPTTSRGAPYLLRPGDILLTDNKDIHRPDIRPGKPYERFVLWIMPSYLSQIAKFGSSLTDCFADASAKKHQLIRPESGLVARLKNILEKIIENRDGKELGSSVLENIYLIEFMVYLNRAYYADSAILPKDITENEKINAVVAYINDHLDEELTLDRLAETFFVSKSYLSHQFKAYTGLTLFQFIIKKRLTVARNMISEGAAMMDACMRCGFNDYSNFHKAFKKEFGRSPKEYKSQ